MQNDLGRRLRVAFLAVGSAALAAACGGGGGGGSTAAPGGEAPVAGAPVPPPPPPPPPPATPVGQIGNVAWVQNAIRLERDVFVTAVAPTLTASLSIQAPGTAYWFRYSHNSTVARVSYTFRTVDDGIDFSINFHTPVPLPPGSYTDTLSVTLCRDEACTQVVPGSPFTLPLQMDVGFLARGEAGIAPLVPAQTTVLNHDVVAAAYSRALDAMVTVSARPEPALRIHDLRQGTVRRLALLTAPTSLSLGADGLSAAVGHDAAVALVNLREGATDPVRRIAVPLPVGAVALAGSRVVAIETRAGLNSAYWVDTASGSAAVLGNGFLSLYGVVEPIVHPSGERLYVADRDLYPDDVRRMDLNVEPSAVRILDSRYHGEYTFCGRLVISGDGRRLYTACGVVLSSASTVADDMLYAGRMALSPRDPAGVGDFVGTALSLTPDEASLALLEENRYTCDPRIDQLYRCYTRLAVYDTTTLARRSFFGLQPYVRGNDRLQQWGRRLMHRSDGSLLLVTEVRTKDEATPTWLLHRVP
jgi:hypothetical protein